MIDVEELEKTYKKYLELEKEYKANQDKVDYGLKVLTDYLSEEKEKEHILSDKEVLNFKEENKDVKKVNLYREKVNQIDAEMNRLLRSYFSRYSQFALINDDNKEMLVDLKYLEKFDVTNMNSELKNFIIKMLETQKIYIGKIDVNDLPLLMEIKEDVELPYINKSDLSFEDAIEEKRLYESSICSKIRKSYDKALKIRKIIDNKQGLKLPKPFIYKSEDVLRAWNEFDDKKLKDEEYWVEYYKLLIQFGNSVEKLYQEANDDIKKYVLIAYQNIVNQADIRTQSPLINEKVLLKKYATNKK